jgi:1,4-dihydroxy-2-naphthoyl-CoA hydrolase
VDHSIRLILTIGRKASYPVSERPPIANATHDSDAGHASRRNSKMTNPSEASELMKLLDIQLDECTPAGVRGSIAADERHHQPWGIVHGGLYTTAIESFATLGAYEAVKDRGELAMGIANTTDFIRPHRTGRLRVAAAPIHLGRTQQLWQVDIHRPEDDKLVARGQVRLQNVEARS